MTQLPLPTNGRASRIALIGVGGFGSVHLRHLARIEAAGLGQLCAVADPFIGDSAEVQARLSAPTVRRYLDYRDLLAAGLEIDLVIIATPIALHEPMARFALEHTRAAIYLEKPPVPTLGQLETLIALDVEQRVHVGFQMITWKCFRDLKTLLCQGRLGRIRRITTGAVWSRTDSYYQRANWAGRLVNDAGEPIFDGPATNALAHLVHNLMFLAHPDMEGFDRPVEVRGEFYRAREIESYDAACLAGRFPSGIEYAAAVAHCSRDEQDFVVRVEGESGEAWITRNKDQVLTSFSAPEPFDHEYDEESQRQTILRARSSLQPVTSLTACLGYSEATCGGLLSSGNIHQIAGRFVDAGRPDPQRVCHVHEIRGAVARTIKTGLLWSEQGVSWARAARPVQAECLSRQDFDLGSFSPASRNNSSTPSPAQDFHLFR